MSFPYIPHIIKQYRVSKNFSLIKVFLWNNFLFKRELGVKQEKKIGAGLYGVFKVNFFLYFAEYYSLYRNLITMNK